MGVRAARKLSRCCRVTFLRGGSLTELAVSAVKTVSARDYGVPVKGGSPAAAGRTLIHLRVEVLVKMWFNFTVV